MDCCGVHACIGDIACCGVAGADLIGEPVCCSALECIGDIVCIVCLIAAARFGDEAAAGPSAMLVGRLTVGT